MAKPLGVIDTSCVIALDRLNLLPQLTLLFAQLLIPKAVRAELFRRRLTKDRIRALLREYAFMRLCYEYDQGAVDVLLTERTTLGQRHRGETEAVVQASAVGAAIILDDRSGRELAARYSLECHGTVWILDRLQALGLLTAHQVRQHFSELKQLRIRFGAQAANQLLRRLGVQEL